MMTKQKQTLGYEDVPLYSWCRYRGRYGWVMDKGDHVSDNPARYILIDFEDTEKPSTMKIHENLVNKHLAKKEKLWVDFGDIVCPYIS